MVKATTLRGTSRGDATPMLLAEGDCRRLARREDLAEWSLSDESSTLPARREAAAIRFEFGDIVDSDL